MNWGCELSYKVYKIITFIFIILAYICFNFNVSVVFENFLGSLFSLVAAITSRIYYVSEIRELCGLKEQSFEVRRKIQQTIRASIIAPLMLALPAIGLLMYGLFD